jgi:hypothetical protein
LALPPGTAPAVASAPPAPSSGEVIDNALRGNTVEGIIGSTGAYAEFYSPDGYLRGKGYYGLWSIRGDSLCIVYENSAESCLQASVRGDQVIWLKDGKIEGDGTILRGNPDEF